MEAKAERLRATVVALGRTRRNEPIPLELRAELIAWARKARARGEGWGAIARALGVSSTGLQRWLAQPRPRPSPGAPLRRVRVASPAARSAAGAPVLRVISPSGYCVEGLGVAEAAALLRALG